MLDPDTRLTLEVVPLRVRGAGIERTYGMPLTYGTWWRTAPHAVEVLAEAGAFGTAPDVTSLPGTVLEALGLR